ncbi:MAG TPA: peptide-methionine (S)-S-oxide reductase, partial [Mycobacteriales bacterium]
MFLFRSKPEMVAEADALPGRDTPVPVAATHAVLGTPMQGPWPDGFETAVLGMGCFWGVERIYWQTPGVYSTAAG